MLTPLRNPRIYTVPAGWGSGSLCTLPPQSQTFHHCGNRRGWVGPLGLKTNISTVLKATTFLVLLDYVSRGLETKICPFSVVCPSYVSQLPLALIREFL